MARRDPRTKSALEAVRTPSTAASMIRPEAVDEGDESFARLGEALRRLALGLAAMLFVARAYYPSEDAESGTGLIWVFAMLATIGAGRSPRPCSPGRSGSAGRGPTRRSWP